MGHEPVGPRRASAPRPARRRRGRRAGSPRPGRRAAGRGRRPRVTQIVWPFGCVCQAVRAPGVKWTLARARRAKRPDGSATASRKTEPVNHSVGPGWVSRLFLVICIASPLHDEFRLQSGEVSSECARQSCTAPATSASRTCPTRSCSSRPTRSSRHPRRDLRQRPLAVQVDGAERDRPAHGARVHGLVEEAGAEVRRSRGANSSIAPFLWSDGTCVFCQRRAAELVPARRPVRRPGRRRRPGRSRARATGRRDAGRPAGRSRRRPDAVAGDAGRRDVPPVTTRRCARGSGRARRWRLSATGRSGSAA